ncbi:MAG: DUF4129 domain-containing protein [Propionibacteriaceae bacterium]
MKRRNIGVAVAILLAFFALGARAASSAAEAFHRTQGSQRTLPPPPSHQAATFSVNGLENTTNKSSPLFGIFLVTVLAVFLMVIVFFVVMMLLNMKRRLAAKRKKALDDDGIYLVLDDEDKNTLTTRFEDALSRLRAGGNIDDVILDCWVTLQKVVARQGVIRDSAQTAEEFIVEVLSETELPRTDLETLASLYRSAMFSNTESTADDRVRAITALENVTAALS